MKRGRGRVRGRLALVAIAAMAVGLYAAGSAYGVAQNIVAAPGSVFSAPIYTMDQGDRPLFLNQDLTIHNVRANGTGPDGQPLFSTPDISGGGSAAVNGTQFLTAGSYGFICSIHPTTMIATLSVSANGAPLARPSLQLSIGNKNIEKVIKRGVLVNINSSAKADGVSLELKLGNATIGKEEGLSTAAGSQVFRVKVNKAGKKKLSARETAKVTVTGKVPFGLPSTAAAKLK